MGESLTDSWCDFVVKLDGCLGPRQSPEVWAVATGRQIAASLGDKVGSRLGTLNIN
jgi:hypothetical protein